MRRITLPLALGFTLLLALSACSGNRRPPDSAGAQLAFGTSMAQRGLWQEALFRFNEAERLDPQNFHVHNNLGVAYEASGDYEKALAHYKKALEIAPTNREAKANYARFIEFYQSYKGKPGDKKATNTVPSRPAKGRRQRPEGGGSEGGGTRGGLPPEPQPPGVPPPGLPPAIPPTGR